MPLTQTEYLWSGATPLLLISPARFFVYKGAKIDYFLRPPRLSTTFCASLAPTRPFPAVWGQRIAYCNGSALLVVAMDIRGTLLASVPRVWSSPMCVWMRWAVTRAPKKACHEMSEKGLKSAQIKVRTIRS